MAVWDEIQEFTTPVSAILPEFLGETPEELWMVTAGETFVDGQTELYGESWSVGKRVAESLQDVELLAGLFEAAGGFPLQPVGAKTARNAKIGWNIEEPGAFSGNRIHYDFTRYLQWYYGPILSATGGWDDQGLPSQGSWKVTITPEVGRTWSLGNYLLFQVNETHINGRKVDSTEKTGTWANNVAGPVKRPEEPNDWTPTFLDDVSSAECVRYMNAWMINKDDVSSTSRWVRLPPPSTLKYVTFDPGTNTFTSEVKHNKPNATDPVSGGVYLHAPDGTVPTGFSGTPNATKYYVINATDYTFQLSETVGGAPVDGSDAGSGTIGVVNQGASGVNQFVRKTLTPADIVEIAGRTGVTSWICIHHRWDDNEVQEIADEFAAAFAAQGVSTPLIVEYSNEIWNGDFPQEDWILEKAATLNYKNDAQTPAGQYQAASAYALDRSDKIAQIFKDTLSVPVTGVWATQLRSNRLSGAWDNYSDTIGDRRPYSYIDAFAVAPYWGQFWTSNLATKDSSIADAMYHLRMDWGHDGDIVQNNKLIDVSFDHTTDVWTTSGNHFFENNYKVYLDSDGTLPANFATYRSTDPARAYYVINKTSNTFQLAETVGGAAIVDTGNGTGQHTVMSNNTIRAGLDLWKQNAADKGVDLYFYEFGSSLNPGSNSTQAMEDNMMRITNSSEMADFYEFALNYFDANHPGIHCAYRRCGTDDNAFAHKPRELDATSNRWTRMMDWQANSVVTTQNASFNPLTTHDTTHTYFFSTFRGAPGNAKARVAASYKTSQAMVDFDHANSMASNPANRWDTYFYPGTPPTAAWAPSPLNYYIYHFRPYHEPITPQRSTRLLWFCLASAGVAVEPEATSGDYAEYRSVFAGTYGREYKVPHLGTVNTSSARLMCHMRPVLIHNFIDRLQFDDGFTIEMECEGDSLSMQYRSNFPQTPWQVTRSYTNESGTRVVDGSEAIPNQRVINDVKMVAAPIITETNFSFRISIRGTIRWRIAAPVTGIDSVAWGLNLDFLQIIPVFDFFVLDEYDATTSSTLPFSLANNND